MKISCLYLDGLHAQQHPCILEHQAGMLILKERECGKKKAFWHLEDIQIIQKPSSGSPGKLGCVYQPDIRLIIHSLEDWNTLIALLPQSAFKKQLPITYSSIVLYAVLTCLCLAFFYKAIPIFIEQSVAFIPTSVDTKIGDQIVLDLHEELGRCENKESLDALTKMVTLIAPSYDLNVSVVDFALENALAFPGNSIVLFGGFIKNAESPEEMLFVLAHEMGHVKYRHAMKSFVRSQGLSFLLRLTTGNVSMIDTGVLDIVGSLGNLHNNRGNEAQSDQFALDLLLQKNIDLQKAPSFFERAQKQEAIFDLPDVLDLLSTHPETEERIRHIKETAKTQRKMQGEKNKYAHILSKKEWKALKSICYKEKEEK